MDDPLNLPDPSPFELPPENVSASDREVVPESVKQPFNEIVPAVASENQPALVLTHAAEAEGRIKTRRQNLLHNLLLLLALTLTAFTLTAWILIRMDSPFGIFSSGPQEIVHAQLLALDRGELRPAYDMFSARYRGQISFDDWHQLIVTHRQMFHAEVLRSEVPSSRGPGIALEIYLRDADDRDYRARFTLIHSGGRWWIDDVHWMEEPDQRGISRT
jgi:hypothetical protein